MIFNKFRLTLLLPLVFVTSFMAQNVGIGTRSPHPSALLDLDVSSKAANDKKGVLIPRVALTGRTDVTTVPAPAVGLLVFNTATSITDPTIEANNFYFWNGSRWADIATSKTFRSKLYPQIYIVANTGSQDLNKAAFNAGTPQQVLYNPTATGAMNVNVGDRVSLANSNFTIRSAGFYEITGYVGYNPWVATNCTTQATENTCTAALDFILQRSQNNGDTWTNIAKTTALWGVGTGDRNRSVHLAPFIINLNTGDLIRAVIAKGSATNHGAIGSTFSIETGTGLNFSRLLRIQKID